MEYLPPELVGIIVGNFDSPSDLLSLRQVSWRICRATQHAFETAYFSRIYVSLTPNRLRRLSNITSHDSIRKAVKILTLVAPAVQPNIVAATRKLTCTSRSHASGTEIYWPGEEHASPDLLWTGDDQSRPEFLLGPASDAVRTFVRCVSLLSSCTRFEWTDGCQQVSHFRTCSTSRWALKLPPWYATSGWALSLTECLQVLFWALRERSPDEPVPSFHVRLFQSEKPEQPMPMDYTLLRSSAFHTVWSANVRDLVIQFSPVDQRPGFLDALVELVTRSPKLTTLRIALSQNKASSKVSNRMASLIKRAYDEPPAGLGQIPAPVIDITLGTIYISPRSLCDILSCFRGTLRKVYLFGISLTSEVHQGSGWATVFNHLADKFSCLDFICFEPCQDCCGDYDVIGLCPLYRRLHRGEVLGPRGGFWLGEVEVQEGHYRGSGGRSTVLFSCSERYAGVPPTIAGVRFELGKARPRDDMVALLRAMAAGNHLRRKPYWQGPGRQDPDGCCCPDAREEMGLVRVTRDNLARWKRWTGLES